jgi:flagellar motor switch/type III secretory pathway protein FliN
MATMTETGQRALTAQGLVDAAGAAAPVTGSGLDAAARGEETAEGAAANLESHAAWPLLSRLPVQLAAAVPVTGFRVRDLLQLAAGKLLETAWAENEDIPLRAGRVQMSWCEFEVVERRLSVRLTRLA